MVVSLMSSEFLDQVVELYDIIALAEALDAPVSKSLFDYRLWTRRRITPTPALPVPGASVTAPSCWTLEGVARRRSGWAEKPTRCRPPVDLLRNSPSLPRPSHSVQAVAVATLPGDE